MLSPAEESCTTRLQMLVSASPAGCRMAVETSSSISSDVAISFMVVSSELATRRVGRACAGVLDVATTTNGASAELVSICIGRIAWLERGSLSSQLLSMPTQPSVVATATLCAAHAAHTGCTFTRVVCCDEPILAPATLSDFW